MSRLLHALVLALTVTGAAAQILTLPAGQPPAERQGISMPKRGMSQAEVEAQFGHPLVKGAAIGQPPISHWEYADYDVYFEQDQVLHSAPRPEQQ